MTHCRYDKYLKNSLESRYDWLLSRMPASHSSRLCMAIASVLQNDGAAGMQQNAIHLNRFRQCIWSNKSAERGLLRFPKEANGTRD